jgi:NAD(P)-dependent dehydrogenase (short-subunit alcohol dehydrogenase family)
MNLIGNTIFITGGGSGIGRALALAVTAVYSWRQRANLIESGCAEAGRDMGKGEPICVQ